MTQARRGWGRLRPGLSIETRIAAGALATAVSVLLAATAVFFVGQYRSEIDGAAAAQLAAGQVAARGAAPALHDPRDAAGVLASLDEAPGLDRAYLADGEGRILARHVWRRAIRAADAKLPTSVSAIRVPVRDAQGRPVGELVLAPAKLHGSTVLPQAFAVCGALFFAATGLALVLGRAMARKIVEPVERLAALMRAIADTGALEQRATMPADVPREVAALAAGFDTLLDRLQGRNAELHATLAALTIARDAAQAASVLKSQFLANMSHEIRTPLNGVLAMTQVMAMGELDAEQRDRLRVVRESGEALLLVLNDVLDVSKIESGKMELESAPFDLAAAVRSACDGFTATVEAKGLELEVRIAAGAVGLRRGDEARMRQVVVNLVSNAVKFTAAGRVTVELEAVGAKGAEGVLLRVRDTGLGFDEAQIPHLFDTFTQADPSTTRRFGGTGLGLAICRELVELMGGEVSAHSTPGEGSCFEVRAPLPAVARPAAAPDAVVPRMSVTAKAGAGKAGAAEAGRAEAGRDRRLRFLAAEDNPTNQLVLSTIMDVFGIALDMVGDGRAAVEAWRSGDYDAILMDVQMPEMDGVEASQLIRAAERAESLPRTPIIALSANAMTHQVREYLAAGMDAHVPKPIELERLQATLQAVLMRDPAHVDAESAAA